MPSQPPSRGERARDFAVDILRTLRQAGHVAYFAGGCVRDELLGLHPKDYDVATDATPSRVAELYPRAALVGAHFGVVLVKAPGTDGVVTEVATFRTDGPYSDRRRPDRVTFSDARTDAQRRDFTVNALFLDPLADPPTPRHAEVAGADRQAAGNVVDFVGGLADLDARILRAVGDPEARLAEDHLRALRAVRLAARLGFQIESRTADAIHRHARDLAGVSRERIGDEIRKILSHPNRGVGVALLQRLGLDEPVLGSALADVTLPRLRGLPTEAPVPWSLAAIALDRQDITAETEVNPVLAKWRRSMCLSNDECDATNAVLSSYFFVKQSFMTSGVAAQKRSATSPGFVGGLALLATEDMDKAAQIQARVEVLRATRSGIAPTPLVTGDDLVAIGFPPGPKFARVLRTTYDAQLEDLFGSREDGLRFATHAWNGLGGASAPGSSSQ